MGHATKTSVRESADDYNHIARRLRRGRVVTRRLTLIGILNPRVNPGGNVSPPATPKVDFFTAVRGYIGFDIPPFLLYDFRMNATRQFGRPAIIAIISAIA